MSVNFGWTDIEEIAIELTEAHPDVDPTTVRFTELRELVEALPGFEPDPERNVNEQILEAVQAAWIEEKQGIERDEDDEGGYQPNNPFR